jgi:hypothetical protein
MYYKQVELSKAIDGSLHRYTAAIPLEFAKKGMVLKIKQDDGSWADGWEVTEVYCVVNTLEVRHQLKHHRKNSDLPRGQLANKVIVDEAWHK